MQDDVESAQVTPLLGLGVHEPHDEAKHLVTSHRFELQKYRRAAVFFFEILLNGCNDIMGCSRIRKRQVEAFS